MLNFPIFQTRIHQSAPRREKPFSINLAYVGIDTSWPRTLVQHITVTVPLCLFHLADALGVVLKSNHSKDTLKYIREMIPQASEDTSNVLSSSF
jgi:hypothetical protein